MDAACAEKGCPRSLRAAAPRLRPANVPFRMLSRPSSSRIGHRMLLPIKEGGGSAGSALSSLRSGDTLYGYAASSPFAIPSPRSASDIVGEVMRSTHPLRPATPTTHGDTGHTRDTGHRRDLLYGRYVRKSYRCQGRRFRGTFLGQTRVKGKSVPRPACTEKLSMSGQALSGHVGHSWFKHGRRERVSSAHVTPTAPPSASPGSPRNRRWT